MEVLVIGLAAGLFLGAFAVSHGSYYASLEEPLQNDSILQEIDLYHACLDGCTYMTRLDYDIKNLTSYEKYYVAGKHYRCSWECCEKHMETTGCYDSSEPEEPIAAIYSKNAVTVGE